MLLIPWSCSELSLHCSHWPACNWCSHGTNHLSGPNQGGSNGTDDSEPGTDDGSPDADDPYEDGGDYTDGDSGDSGDPWERRAINIHRRMVTRRRHLFSRSTSAPRWRRASGDFLSGMATALAEIPTLPQDEDPPTPTDPSVPIDSPVPTDPPMPTDLPAPTDPPDVGDPPVIATGSSTVKTINHSPAPAQAPAKTQNNKCTPSPTKSQPPQAGA